VYNQKLLSRQEFLQWVKIPGFVYFLGMVGPRRPGVLLFAVTLEYGYYPPNTESNKLYELTVFYWEGMAWFAIRIPQEGMKTAQEVAKSIGVRIADGVPVLFGGIALASLRDQVSEKNSKCLVPPENKSVFTLENIRDHPVYAESPESLGTILQAEDVEIERIRGSLKNTN
jgi:hypothetical protein